MTLGLFFFLISKRKKEFLCFKVTSLSVWKILSFNIKLNDKIFHKESDVTISLLPLPFFLPVFHDFLYRHKGFIYSSNSFP